VLLRGHGGRRGGWDCFFGWYGVGFGHDSVWHDSLTPDERSWFVVH
jgi:hypothetical protein